MIKYTEQGFCLNGFASLKKNTSRVNQKEVFYLNIFHPLCTALITFPLSLDTMLFFFSFFPCASIATLLYSWICVIFFSIASVRLGATLCKLLCKLFIFPVQHFSMPSYIISNDFTQTLVAS